MALGALLAAFVSLPNLPAVGLVLGTELLVVGSAAGATWAPSGCVALLAVLFAVGGRGALDVAPLYGAGVLLVGELAAQAAELRELRDAPGQDARFTRAAGWIEGAGERVRVTLGAAALGTLLAALALAAASIGLPRSVLLTLAGTLAVLATGATLTRAARAPQAAADPVERDHVG